MIEDKDSGRLRGEKKRIEADLQEYPTKHRNYGGGFSESHTSMNSATPALWPPEMAKSFMAQIPVRAISA